MQKQFRKIVPTMQFSKYIQIDGKEISFLKKLIEEKSFEYYYFAFEDIKDCDYQEITNYINSHEIDCKNGDIIVFSDPEDLYRNSGRCVWFNGHAIPLSHLSDEYGEIPQCFEISPNNFHPRYWTGTIHHNINYWPCENYRAQCSNNISVFQDNIRYTWFIHDDRKEYVVLDPDTEEKISENIFKEILMDRSKPYSAYHAVDLFLDDMNNANVSVVYPNTL